MFVFQMRRKIKTAVFQFFKSWARGGCRFQSSRTQFSFCFDTRSTLEMFSKEMFLGRKNNKERSHVRRRRSYRRVAARSSVFTLEDGTTLHHRCATSKNNSLFHSQSLTLTLENEPPPSLVLGLVDWSEDRKLGPKMDRRYYLKMGSSQQCHHGAGGDTRLNLRSEERRWDGILLSSKPGERRNTPIFDFQPRRMNSTFIVNLRFPPRRMNKPPICNLLIFDPGPTNE